MLILFEFIAYMTIAGVITCGTSYAVGKHAKLKGSDRRYVGR